MEYMGNPYIFPHPALADGQGVLAFGGELDAISLFLAYSHGIFPWYNHIYEPIFWWAPAPRFVIFPSEVVVTKSMRPYFNQAKFTLTYDRCFEAVMRQCQNVWRKGQQGTWIDENMIRAYSELFDAGMATSAEVWQEGKLVGGLYGVKLGKIFFGESMFTKASNASKFGFISLCHKLEKEGFLVIDCQQPNDHLRSLGGRFISADKWNSYLRTNRKYLVENDIWPL